MGVQLAMRLLQLHTTRTYCTQPLLHRPSSRPAVLLSGSRLHPRRRQPTATGNKGAGRARLWGAHNSRTCSRSLKIASMAAAEADHFPLPPEISAIIHQARTQQQQQQKRCTVKNMLFSSESNHLYSQQ